MFTIKNSVIAALIIITVLQFTVLRHYKNGYDKVKLLIDVQNQQIENYKNVELTLQNELKKFSSLQTKKREKLIKKVVDENIPKQCLDAIAYAAKRGKMLSEQY